MPKIILVIILIGLSFSKIDRSFSNFQDFIKKYNKVYQTPDEFLSKFEIFKSNEKIIRKTLPKAAAKFDKNTQRFGPNQFSDLTLEEFKKTYLTLDVSELEEIEKNSPRFLENDFSSNETIPENWDWREKGAITEIRQQGVCGGCWAFVTVTTLEAQYFIHKGKTQTFSEQQLIDCDYRNKGCIGGVMTKAYETLKEEGLMARDEYPYECGEGVCRFDKKKELIKVKNWRMAGTKDEEKIKRLLYKYGPLGAAVEAAKLMFYEGGIFDPWWDESESKVNHAVTIVGYGRDGGKDYWIVRNTWGKYWGEDGYFRVALGKKIAGINTFVMYVEADFLDE